MTTSQDLAMGALGGKHNQKPQSGLEGLAGSLLGGGQHHGSSGSSVGGPSGGGLASQLIGSFLSGGKQHNQQSQSTSGGFQGSSSEPHGHSGLSGMATSLFGGSNSNSVCIKSRLKYLMMADQLQRIKLTTAIHRRAILGMGATLVNLLQPLIHPPASHLDNLATTTFHICKISNRAKARPRMPANPISSRHSSRTAIKLKSNSVQIPRRQQHTISTYNNSIPSSPRRMLVSNLANILTLARGTLETIHISSSQEANRLHIAMHTTREPATRINTATLTPPKILHRKPNTRIPNLPTKEDRLAHIPLQHLHHP